MIPRGVHEVVDPPEPCAHRQRGHQQVRGDPGRVRDARRLLTAGAFQSTLKPTYRSGQRVGAQEHVELADRGLKVHFTGHDHTFFRQSRAARGKERTDGASRGGSLTRVDPGMCAARAARCGGGFPVCGGPSRARVDFRELMVVGYVRCRESKLKKRRYTAVFKDVRGDERSAGAYPDKASAARAWKSAEASVADGRYLDLDQGRKRFEEYVGKPGCRSTRGRTPRCRATTSTWRST